MYAKLHTQQVMNKKFLKEFRGLREDFDKLPKDDGMASGSHILFVDMGEYAEYLF